MKDKEKKRVCKNCGKELENGRQFCPNCGKEQHAGSFKPALLKGVIVAGVIMFCFVAIWWGSKPDEEKRVEVESTSAVTTGVAVTKKAYQKSDRLNEIKELAESKELTEEEFIYDVINIRNNVSDLEAHIKGNGTIPDDALERVIYSAWNIRSHSDGVSEFYNLSMVYEPATEIYLKGKCDDVENALDCIDTTKLALKKIDEEKETTQSVETYTEPYFVYNGVGDDVISGVKTDGLSYAHIVHSGERYFSVKGHYDDTYDLLVSTTNPYDGKTLIYSNKEYTFEVSATGEWTIELYKMGSTDQDTFAGHGDFVTPVFIGSSDVYEIITNGDGYFSVKGWTDSGYELLVSTTDSYSGKVLLKAKNRAAFFEITGRRDWEIKPVN